MDDRSFVAAQDFLLAAKTFWTLPPSFAIRRSISGDCPRISSYTFVALSKNSSISFNRRCVSASPGVFSNSFTHSRNIATVGSISRFRRSSNTI